MKNRFIVEVKFSAMNEMSLYERLRNAVFEWQTNEPKVRSVSVVPQKSVEPAQQPDNTQSKYASQIPRNIIDRLQAVCTIIGGMSVPSREELDCAFSELESVGAELLTL